MNLTLRVANYMARYAPSRTKITAYLTKKKCQDIEAFLSDIGYDERLMISMWMRTFVTVGKGKREIEMKLIQKWFPKEWVREALMEYIGELEDWEWQKERILHQIMTLQGRGKSQRMIASILVGKYPYFRREIEEILESMDDQDSLEKEMQKYRNRYNLHDPHDREKLIAALMRKGFEYSVIKKGIVISE